MLNHETPIAASRVLSELDEGASEATLTEQFIYTDSRVRENTVQFQRDETGDWRQGCPQEPRRKHTSCWKVALDCLSTAPTH